MNLPNKLTMLRMALIPLFLLLLYWNIPNHFLWAFLIFVGASLTDMLDGKIARARGLVTDFGKFMDPLADKLLVMSALLCFIDVLAVPAVIVVVIVARELTVTALRTLAADNGVVLAADRWGKIKTASQMVWISYSLLLLWVGGMTLPLPWEALYFLYYFGMAAVLVATLGSGINYLYKNRQLFMNSK